MIDDPMDMIQALGLIANKSQEVVRLPRLPPLVGGLN